MANTVLVVQALGSQSLDARVLALTLEGWSLIGSPLAVGGKPSQVMRETGETSADGGYQTVAGTLAAVEQAATALLADGWKMYGDPYERNAYVFQAFIRGDMPIDGVQGGGGSGPGPAPAGLKIRHLTDATYSPTPLDKDYMLVFDVAADVTVTLQMMPATDDSPVSMLLVNTLGRINLVTAPGETLVAYAPHAEQSATIGLTRGGVKWYATGTNLPIEEA